MAEVAELEEHERAALVLRQAREVGDQLAQVGAAADVVGQAVERGLDLVDRHGGVAARGEQRAAAVAGDREQPRPHRVGHTARLQRAVRAHEGLLERVLAVLAVADHVAAEGEQRRVVAVVERLERVASPRATSAARRSSSSRRNRFPEKRNVWVTPARAARIPRGQPRARPRVFPDMIILAIAALAAAALVAPAAASASPYQVGVNPRTVELDGVDREYLVYVPQQRPLTGRRSSSCSTARRATASSSCAPPAGVSRPTAPATSPCSRPACATACSTPACASRSGTTFRSSARSTSRSGRPAIRRTRRCPPTTSASSTSCSPTSTPGCRSTRGACTRPGSRTARRSPPACPSTGRRGSRPPRTPGVASTAPTRPATGPDLRHRRHARRPHARGHRPGRAAARPGRDPRFTGRAPVHRPATWRPLTSTPAATARSSSRARPRDCSGRARTPSSPSG